MNGLACVVALPLAQRDPVLDGLRLVGREVDGLAQRILGGRIGMVEFKHAAELVHCHQLVAKGWIIHHGKAIHQGKPLGDRRAGLALILEVTVRHHACGPLLPALQTRS